MSDQPNVFDDDGLRLPSVPTSGRLLHAQPVGKPSTQPRPMLTQAVANLQALEAEMRGNVLCELNRKVQCWVDKLGTVLADLQEVQP